MESGFLGRNKYITNNRDQNSCMYSLLTIFTGGEI